MVGLHKTGTTSIQDTCIANLPALEAAGFAYPVHATAEGPKSNHGVLLKVAFRGSLNNFGLNGQFDFGNDQAWLTSERKRVRDQFETVLGNWRGSVVLAAENVSTFNESELDEMHSWFVERGWEVRAICHVRHLATWIHSMIAQRVSGGLRLPIAQAVNEFVQAGGIIRPRIERLRAAMPQIQFHSHERAVAHPNGPPGYFLEKIGVPSRDVHFKRANEGSSDIATRLLSIINEKFVRYPVGGVSSPTLLAQETMAMRALEGPKFRLKRDEAEPLLEMIEGERKWLADHLGHEFVGPPLTFDLPVEPVSMAAVRPAIDALPAEVAQWLLANRNRW